jgi:hypothetical protein
MEPDAREFRPKWTPALRSILAWIELEEWKSTKVQIQLSAGINWRDYTMYKRSESEMSNRPIAGRSTAAPCPAI